MAVEVVEVVEVVELACASRLRNSTRNDGISGLSASLRWIKSM